MSRIIYISLFLAGMFFQWYSLTAQPSISAVIPDICSPGMNIAMEILAPASEKGAFGTDGIYLNNRSDIIRVQTLNPADSNKIVFSPFIISWEGRVISIQAFVPPIIAGGPNPNSWDWSLLQNRFRIPICVTVNGVQSKIDTLYIVQPFSFGNRVSESQTSVFGAGTWGKRSRKGAMIVDSMILPLNGKYEISTNDCDPYLDGNQGYLPFTLIVQGNVQGSGSIISVNANRQNGGPGGGGGAGVFCDISNPTSNAGNGYSGGAPGGRNGAGIPFTNNYYTIIGIGTGKGVGGPISGTTITGVQGGECRAYEGGGGGTGHPYGMSGSGSYGRNGEIDGFYGGGSSPTDGLFGGGGGYRTEGASSNAINGGKVVGNRAVVPIAGGSGGGTGNPRAGFGTITCSGYGGGGGGALNFHGQTISNIILEAKGSSGEDNNPNGGGGSGGYIGIGARDAISTMSHSIAGGPGPTSGGEGRFRFESPRYPTLNPFSYPVVNQLGQESYRGVTIESASIVDRSQALSLVYSCGDSIQFFLKSQNGDWIPYTFTEARDQGLLVMPFNDLGLLPDSLYYLMAMQSNRIFISKGEYEKEPLAIISQSAGNVLYAPVYPIIASDTIISMSTPLICTNDTVFTAINIKNKGNGILSIDSTYWESKNNGFFTVDTQNYPINVKAGDSIQITIGFTKVNQKGLLFDTLIIRSNAKNDSSWRVAYSGKAEVIELAYRTIRNPLYQRTFTLTETCIGTPITDSIYIINRTSIPIPSDSVRLSGSIDWTIAPQRNTIPGNDSTIFIIQYIPQNDIMQNISLELHYPLCDTIDRINIQGKGKQTIIIADKPNITSPNQSIGITNTESVTIRNTGTASAFITTSSFGLQMPFQISKTIPALPIELQPGDSLILSISITMASSGISKDTIEILSIANQKSCIDSIFIPITASASLPSLGMRFGNSPKADPKAESYDIPIMYSIPGKDSVLADMTISFTVNGSIFYPKKATKGILSSIVDANGNRIVSVQFTKDPLPINDSILTTVSGIIQLDSMIATPLKWLPAKWNSTPFALINTIDGNIELDICEVGGKRLIINGMSPTLLQMFPNPTHSGKDVQIQFPINRLGRYSVMLTDVSGRIIEEKSIEFNDIHSLGLMHLMQLQVRNLVAGTYFMTISLDGQRMTEQLIIVP
jgi:hypothetical protein